VAAARSRYAADGPLLGFAGRLVYEKGAQYLLNALPELHSQYPRLRVVIAGDGPYRPTLHTEVDRLDLNSVVTLAGFVGEQLSARSPSGNIRPDTAGVRSSTRGCWPRPAGRCCPKPSPRW
jgi:glycosyltransferase involved in cell wall biosynthesis